MNQCYTQVKLAIGLVLFLACNGVWAQPQSQNQTARQALVEMFFSKTPGTFLEHLPVATRAALEKSGALPAMQQYAGLMNQMQMQNKNVQFFETGPVLFSTDDPKTGQKFDILVEKDVLHGDRDDIEVSFQTYKDGKPQQAPFMPRLTFDMRTESGMWTLNELDLLVRVPLADPEFLKTITEGVKSRLAAANMQARPTFASQDEMPRQQFASDTLVLNAMRSILAAEKTYASTYTAVGYTCSLSDLDGFGGGTPNEHQAMLIHSGLASGKRYGYVFTVSNCGGNPAKTFTLTAVPNGNSFGRKAYCADQSGALRSSADGNAANCASGGAPVQ